MQKLTRWIPRHFIFIFLVFIGLLIIFGLFRLVLCESQPLSPETRSYLFYAFFNRGLLFDTATTSYLISLPLLLLSINYLAGRYRNVIIRISAILLGVLVSLAVLVCLADIPYYKYYNSRINKGILSWTDDLWLMFKMTFMDYHYWPFIIAFPALLFLIFRGIKYLRNKCFDGSIQKHNFIQRILIFVLSMGLLFFGIRGEYNLNYKPILTENAFKTPYPLINQLGLNPLFNFLHSMGDFKLDIMDETEAVANVRSYLGVKQHYASPVARDINFSGPARKANIVLVLVESLSTDKMGRYNPGLSLTPYLDSLAQNSICFDNIYTAGVHTYNGVFSTLYGLPALMHNKPTTSSATSSLVYSGLPNILEKQGYQNIFFCPNAKEFDNLEGFFQINGIKKVIDEKNYPDTTIVNGWGVSDHYFFDLSLPRIDSMAANNKPFFATFLTIATHSPYTLPKHIAFKPNSSDVVDQSYEYTDWSIKQFMKAASAKPWFSNTIFVFIGDHGQNFDKTYEMPLSYHHSPLIIYTPWQQQSLSVQKPGLQIDVFPTILGFLQIPYINNTLGIDLMREERPYAFFCADTRIGAVNNEYFLIIDKDKRESLFRYREKDIKNHSSSHKALIDSMKTYIFSNLQVMQYMIRKRLTDKNQAGF